MFEQVSSRDSRSIITDWLLRGGIALAFVAFGSQKFSDPQFVKIFQQIGIGQWFRYFTGVVEIAGGLLLLTPWTVTAGLALLACTMASATLLWITVLGQPANSILTGALCVGLTLFCINRRGN